jgi:DNA modification methylase
MEKNLVLDGPYTNKDFFNFITTSELPRHKWYYFKEGFSVGLVNEAIKAVPKKKSLNILDPFNGSGTTALTSSLLGHNAVGLEVNPFLKFTTKIKTTSWDVNRNTLKANLEKVIQKSEGGAFSPLEGFSTFSPKDGLEKWLFNNSVIRRHASTIACIEQHVNKELQDIFKFAALIAAIDCSNVKKDGKGVRYKSDWKEVGYSGKDFVKKFRDLVYVIADDNEKAPIQKDKEPIILLSDARNAFDKELLNSENFDLVITSPPYLNSFDYTDIYRPELFLGGFVKNNDELKQLRLTTLRSHVQVDWSNQVDYVSNYLKPYLEKVNINKDQLWNQRIPTMINAYFDDLCKVFKNIKPRLNKKGQVWLVVSTSAYAGVHIPVDLIIAELAHELGFKLKGIHCLRYLRTSSQQYNQLNVTKAPLRESLIILENN